MSLHRLRHIASLEDCQLWLVDLDAPALPQEFDCLATDELARAGRFTFARHRERFLAGRAALRLLLSHRTNQPPAALRLDYGPYGKPFLPGSGTPAFNMSHSHGIGLIAVGDTSEPLASIGVDIEVLRPVPDAPELAAIASFEPDECAQLQALGETAARDTAFLLGWTRKEACLKALGSGFSGPSRVATGLTPQQRTAAWSGQRAALHSIELPESDAVAALARLLPAGPTAATTPSPAGAAALVAES